MRFGLDEYDIQKIQNVFSSYPEIQKAILYGSRAKGKYKPYSDIDLALNGEGLNFLLLSAVETDLDYLLLPYTFDISIFHNIKNNDLIDHINRVGKIFYERNELTCGTRSR